VQVGTGANCIGLYVDGTQGMWQIAVIWILAATIGIFASGKISGGHLNPAVTLSFAVVRPSDFALANVVPYWAAQVLGAMLGAMINLTIFYRAAIEFEQSVGVKRGSAASIQSAEALSDYWSLSDFVDNSLHALFLEAFGTAFLVFVIFMITNPANNVPSGAVPILVGIAIGSMVNILGPLTKYVQSIGRAFVFASLCLSVSHPPPLPPSPATLIHASSSAPVSTLHVISDLV